MTNDESNSKLEIAQGETIIPCSRRACSPDDGPQAGRLHEDKLTPKHAQIAQRFESLYAELQAEIDRRRPKCELSGRCCQFEEFGHRMYITSGELSVFAQKLNVLPNPPSTENWDGKGCPFQNGKLCGVHSIRPMGCRIFFCDSTSTDWQNQQYEAFHQKVKHLHEELGIAYSYTEWREALGQIGIVPQ